MTKGIKNIICEHKPLTQAVFQKYVKLIYENIGIVLADNKHSLVSSRIGKLMRKTGFDDYELFFKHVEHETNGQLMIELLNAISTNVTHFFREKRHFTLLSQFLKQWEQKGQKQFKIWCAAASTGEEPYSIAITAKRALQNYQNCKILATDISTDALQTAQQGIYTLKSLEKVPNSILAKYFKTYSKNGEQNFIIKNELKKMIRLGRINLAKTPIPLKGPLDIVFCRNVMIYFDNNIRRTLLKEIARILKKGGYLFVGHSESLSGMLEDFSSVEPAVYIKK